MMEWISVRDDLPKEKDSVLGICHSSNDEMDWIGIVQVYFDREEGWRRCELYDKKPLRVFFWTKDFEQPKQFFK